MENTINFLPDIHHWAGFEPAENQYAKYHTQPEVLAAAHKIIDVYWMLCSARAHLKYFEAQPAGGNETEPCGNNVLYEKSLFCFDSLMQYAICVDLSWQVVWAFYQATSLEYLLENKYEEMSVNCTCESVNVLLNCRIAFPSDEAQAARDVKKLINSFLNDELTQLIRKKYNYIKHRGKYHINGLGDINRCLFFKVEGNNIPVLCRQSVDIDSVYKKLILFDVKFVKYFEEIIQKLIPAGFAENSGNH